MDLVEEIKKIAADKLVNPALFVVDVIVSSRKGPKKILVIIDGDQGVTIDDCAELSRELAKTFDELNWIEENYILEVSTPGLDQPLALLRQYKKNIGRNLKIKQGSEIIEGKLTEVLENEITLTQEIGTGKKMEIKVLNIPFADIEKAFVLVSFK